MSHYATSATLRKGGVPSRMQTDNNDLSLRVDRLLRMTKDSIEDVRGGYLHASSPTTSTTFRPSSPKHAEPPSEDRAWSESRRKLDKTDFIDEQTQYNDPVQSPPFSVFSSAEYQSKYSEAARSPEDDERSRRTKPNPSREEWNQSKNSPASLYDERSRRRTMQKFPEEGWEESSYRYSTRQPQRPRSPVNRRPTGGMSGVGSKDREYDDVSRMLHLQETHIKALEKENDELRGLVVHLLQLNTQETQNSRARQPQWKTTPEQNRPDPAYQAKSPPETSSSFEPDTYRSRALSPGSKFVAELSQVLELEPGHHALLSDIVDKNAGIALSPRNDDLRYRWK